MKFPFPRAGSAAAEAVCLPAAPAGPADAAPPGPQALAGIAAIASVAAIALVFIVLGHDGRRILQLFILMLPALLWWIRPRARPRAGRIARMLIWLWVMASVIDGAARAYLLDAYQSAPDGALVVGAVANTNTREGSEYFETYWSAILLWAAVIVAAGLPLWHLLGRARGAAVIATIATAGHGPRRLRRPVVWGLALVLLVCAAAYASKPWRRMHPLIFWSIWADSVADLEAAWSDQQLARERALALAEAAVPVILRPGASTVVLIVSDSVNRDNLGLYGYGRATTPRLEALQQQLGPQMTVLRNAWSVDASTIPSLRNVFSFGSPGRPDSQHLLALARAAGYKVWWLSNHDDIAVEQQHARFADVVEMINRMPGRATVSLDEALLDGTRGALEDPATRKFIVVHLLGAHPHYRLRFPAGRNVFDGVRDRIEAELVRSGRSASVRQSRSEYDSALLYHDSVAAETLRLVREVGDGAAHKSWLYLSDHGQEVGHVSDRAGHSPHTESGYRIPAIVWRNDPLVAPRPGIGVGAAGGGAAGGPGGATGSVGGEVAGRPFRADWAGWTIADLLALDWVGRRPGRNVLGPDYQWQPPRLPVLVHSFADVPTHGPSGGSPVVIP